MAAKTTTVIPGIGRLSNQSPMPNRAPLFRPAFLIMYEPIGTGGYSSDIPGSPTLPQRMHLTYPARVGRSMTSLAFDKDWMHLKLRKSRPKRKR